MIRIIALALLSLLTLAGAAQAQVCQVPWIFNNGSGGTFQPDANQMNANFAAVEKCLIPATTTSLGLVQPDGRTITVNGQGVISAGLSGNSVLSNIALGAAATTAYPVGVLMTAYSGAPLAPTSPPLFYLPSSSPCSLNAGAGDGGSQVKSADNLCWIASPQSAWDIRWWGLTPNPVNFYVSPSGSDGGSPGSGKNFCVVQSIPCATRTQATAMALDFNMLAGIGACGKFSGVADIHIAAGLTVAESVSVSGPLLGGGSCSPNPLNGYGTPMVLFDGTAPYGGGSGATVWNGGPNYCYVVQGSNNGIVGLQGITLESVAPAPACQYEIAAQIQGNVNVFNDVVFGPGQNSQVGVEDLSTVQFWCGGFLAAPPGCKITGGGARFAQVSTNGTILFNKGVNIAIVGSPFYSTAEFLGAFFGGVMQFQTNDPFISGSIPSFTRAFLAYGNSVILNQTSTPSASLVPGAGVGELFDGARIVPHVLGVVEAGFTGLGTGGNVTAAPAGQYGASIFLTTGPTPGTGQSVSGGLVYNPGVLVGDIQDSGTTMPCVLGLDQGGGSFWPSGAMAETSVVNGGTGEIVLDWQYSTVTPIPAGTILKMNLVCNGG